MGKMARITWPEDYSELQRIDELLLCGICYEYMDTSVMTPCSHNYCSLCIRKYLHYKTQCPACFEKTFEKDLHTNRLLDDLILYFGKIRVKLVNCIAGAKLENSPENEDIRDSPRVTPVRPARMNQNQKKTPPSKIAAERSTVAAGGTCEYRVEESPLPETIVAKILSTPSTSRAPKVAKIFTPKSKGNASDGVVNKKTVQCPVCGVEISEVHVNKHLDDCLKRENAIPQCARISKMRSLQPVENKALRDKLYASHVRLFDKCKAKKSAFPIVRIKSRTRMHALKSQLKFRIEPKRKPLPKLVFRLMKDAELRRKMKELGLPSQGDRKTLEARFQRYSILYNSECDKVEPRSVEELLKQCEEEENLEKKHILKNAHATNRLKVTRNSENIVIEEAQKKYRESNKQSYDSLIAAIKNREASKKLPVRRTLLEKDEKDLARESIEKPVTENNLMHINEDDEADDRVPYSMIDYENLFQDSDSSSTCPLQHYTSDDPTNFLSIQMSSADGDSPTPSSVKSSPFKMRISGENSPNTRVSPIKNTKLTDSPSEKSSANTAKDILNVTTDSESSDEDVILPSPEAATSHFTKRAKLSLQQIRKIDDTKPKFELNKSEGQKLAQSIARDFTFDSSSNDGDEAEAVHETADTKTTEMLSAEAPKAEHITPDISNRDKENHKSSTPSSNTVNRPVRKRNCVTRTRKNDNAELTKLKETMVTVPECDDYTHTQVDEKVETPPRIDSPLKRRRGRKAVTPLDTEIKNPPRRPLRKRNSVVPENAHKRS